LALHNATITSCTDYAVILLDVITMHCSANSGTCVIRWTFRLRRQMLCCCRSEAVEQSSSSSETNGH